MLVLNTNQGGGGENVLSNANVMTNYPDIDNSILLFPDRWNSNSKTLATINWLTFSMLWWIISKNDLLNIKMPTINFTYIPPQLWFYTGSASTQRITTIETLSQLVWVSIWKKIVLPDLIMHQWSISIKVWILHTDWTITYFNNDSISYTWSNDIWYMSDYNRRWDRVQQTNDFFNYFGRIPSQRIIETNWIVVQEWDRVYAELTTSSDASVSFWSYYPTKSNFSIKPIQFSID